MNIGWWNIRGFAKSLKHKSVLSLLNRSYVAVFGLVKTKFEEGKLFEIMRWKFKG